MSDERLQLDQSVYRTYSGTFHCSADCGGLTREEASLREALEDGDEPCHKCVYGEIPDINHP